ncbi:glycoside hydrolase family 127 protein [Stakelama saccharophila]|uniref:Glycoside hydrolase family 127 protein n=1 Tax=Stakelama saccharophila TaxID=3075605 RepID=A0ABZ0B4L6_9SPHN|nr:glycoside hydrolase family 127 protein [Stakelama sp. W311]WNO52341.1 glycoside hydrolase family 127 protein [Stakelama sp. W311]
MWTRRAFLASVSIVALAGPVAARSAPAAGPRIRVQPVPLESVRLKPGPFLNAVARNREYLLSLDADRLLHNFRASAGLQPKAPVYGGWEARGIAGHTLGHYLSACSLMHAQTGDPAVRDHIHYIVDELAACQAAHGDGYIGGTTVERDGKEVDGKIVFEEIRRGTIESGGFDVNGGWVPLYTWHKVHAGLIDAYRTGKVERALPVMLGMAGYLATILEGLSDAQMQTLLKAEYGGLNESYANTHAITGDPRWLRVAEKIYDRRVLDPLTAEKDRLAGLHANTQIPKLIGLARIYELNGEPRDRIAARFFRNTVANHHSYVIGGNSQAEHFGPPDQLSDAITERTCEHCNSYNMLKLTRHQYGWAPDAALFDFYERVHLNHVLASQNPETGMFAYFMPLSAGAKRTWSTPHDSFWCCVGSGMESHAKHGDSIYWHDADTLYVNLFIPSTLDWEGGRLDLSTDYPFSDTITLTINAPMKHAIALRLPGWSKAPSVAVNGAPARLERRNGYAVLRREWRAGDRIELTVPMALTVEPTPDDPGIVAYTHGPIVLGADLGPASEDWDGLPPALVAATPEQAATPIDAAAHRFRLTGTKPEAVTLLPFFNQYDRRTAVYFPTFTRERWNAEEAAFIADQRARQALKKRTVDGIDIGEQQPERDHDIAFNHADLQSWAGKSGRLLPWGTGNYIEFTLAVRPGPMVLRALYWGEEVDKDFAIEIDGHLLAEEHRSVPPVKEWVAQDYPIPEALTRGKHNVRVRFETRGTDARIYEVRMLEAAAGA